MDRIAVEKMSLEELRVRLSDLRRSGALGGRDDWEFKMSMGFAGAVNRAAAGKNGPTEKMRNIAVSICREHRYYRVSDGTEPVDLIDRDDDDAAREMARNYEDF